MPRLVMRYSAAEWSLSLTSLCSMMALKRFEFMMATAACAPEHLQQLLLLHLEPPRSFSSLTLITPTTLVTSSGSSALMGSRGWSG